MIIGFMRQRSSISSIWNLLRHYEKLFLKTRRFGYDGKGQVRINADTSLDTAWADIGENPSVYEGFVRFDAEFSILLARAEDGSSVVYPAPRNTHESGILALSEVPAPAARRADESYPEIVAPSR